MSISSKKVCINCKVKISQKAKKCKDCFHKSTRGRIAWNKGLRTDYSKCIDCGEIKYAGKGRLRCKNCVILHPNSLKNLNLYRDKVIEINRKNPPHLGKKHSEESKRKMSATKQGISLNEWKDFTKSINSRIRESIEYEQWRKSIFERDNYTCQKCGQIGGKLEADHIKSFAKYPELRFELSNGRTLCHECHLKTDTWGWRTRWQKI